MTLLTLDATQRRAATSVERLQLVLAGPGSGKTTTLAARFVHLVQDGVDRTRILALTFTKKAADEMKARIAAALDLSSAADLNVATFHGFAFRQLKRNPRAARLSDHFQLWDTPQQRHVFNSRRMWWNEDVDILDIIAGAKERLLDAESFAAEIDGNNEVLVNAVNFFSIYQQALESAGAIDFADMVPLVVRAMVQDAVYSQTVTSRYDHLLIDEYQDVNPGQVQLIDRFVQVDHRHCRPAANETMLGLRRAVGTEVVHWLGANKPAYKLDPGFLEHPRLSPRAVIGPGARFLDFLFTGAPRRRRNPGGGDGAVASTMLRS